MKSGHRRRPRRPNLTREALDAIPMWVELGAKPADIADALGTNVDSLYNVCQRNSISLRPSGGVIVRALSPQQWTALRGEATRRGVPVWKLVTAVVAGVADHDLFAAVLGDYDDPAEETEHGPS